MTWTRSTEPRYGDVVQFEAEDGRVVEASGMELAAHGLYDAAALTDRDIDNMGLVPSCGR